MSRDKAGEGVDCGRPRDQEYLERADMVERSSTHGIYANRSEKSSVPGELRADMVEKSSVPGELRVEVAESGVGSDAG